MVEIDWGLLLTWLQRIWLWMTWEPQWPAAEGGASVMARLPVPSRPLLDCLRVTSDDPIRL